MRCRQLSQEAKAYAAAQQADLAATAAEATTTTASSADSSSTFIGLAIEGGVSKKREREDPVAEVAPVVKKAKVEGEEPKR